MNKKWLEEREEVKVSEIAKAKANSSVRSRYELLSNEIEERYALYLKLGSLRAAAEAYNVTHQDFWYLFKKHGLSTTVGWQKKRAKELRAKVLEFYPTHSMREIKKAFKVSQSVVNEILDEAMVEHHKCGRRRFGVK